MYKGLSGGELTSQQGVDVNFNWELSTVIKSVLSELFLSRGAHILNRIAQYLFKANQLATKFLTNAVTHTNTHTHTLMKTVRHRNGDKSGIALCMEKPRGRSQMRCDVLVQVATNDLPDHVHYLDPPLKIHESCDHVHFSMATWSIDTPIVAHNSISCHMSKLCRQYTLCAVA